MYYLDNLLHDETEIDNNISFQDGYGENEGSLSLHENDPSPVLQQPFQIGNQVTFGNFQKVVWNVLVLVYLFDLILHIYVLSCVLYICLIL